MNKKWARAKGFLVSTFPEPHARDFRGIMIFHFFWGGFEREHAHIAAQLLGRSPRDEGEAASLSCGFGLTWHFTHF